MLMTFFIGISHIIAQDPLLKLKGISPSENSSITNFDFTLDFDFSEVIATYGEDEYGIGWVGFHNDKLPAREKSVSLYEGDDVSGKFLGRTCSSNFTGNSADFEPSSSIRISFPEIIPTEGQEYTLVITNEFKVFTKAKGATPLSNTTLSYYGEPLKIKFIGGKSSTESLALVRTSIQGGDEVGSLSEMTYTFNIPISITQPTRLQIKEGDNIIGESINSFISEDKLSLTYKFDNIPLYLSHTYTISLLEGIIASESNPNNTNNAFNINISGTSIMPFNLHSSTPENAACCIFNSIECIFDMPDNYIIYDNKITIVNHKIDIYEGNLNASNFIGSLTGTINSTNNGLIWDNTFSLYPEKTYILHIPEGRIRAYSTIESKYAKDYGNEEVMIEVTTPSVADSGLAPMEFQAPVFGQHGKDAAFTPESKVSYIQNVEIALNDLRYDYNGTPLALWITPESKFLVYDVTTGEDNLIAEGHVTLQTRETSTSYYSVVSLPVNRTFFNGRKYRIVIPEGQVSVSAPLIQNYVKNSLWSVEFEGSAPTDVNLISCTLQDNVELSALPVVIWEFEGEFVQNEDLRAILHSSYEIMGKPAEVNAKINTITSLGNNVTRVAMLNYNWDNGGPTNLSTTRQYEVILPEGIIYYENDPSIKNKELRYTIIPVEAQSNEKTEFVDLTVTINGLASATQKTVKNESVTVKLTPSADWKVAELTRNGSDVIDFLEDGEYETPALTENTEITARVEYDGLWAIESTVGVWSIPDTKISVYSENGQIVVSGATSENQIMVYGVNGILIKSVTPKNNTDITTISVEPGNIYIVMVDGVAAKIQL